MALSRPTADQILFESSTGSHVLDEYLQNAELGDRELSSLLSDIFAPTGNIHADFIQLRLSSSNSLEIRAGQYINPLDGWQSTGITFLLDRSTWQSSTPYSVLDLVTHNNVRYLCTTQHTSSTTFDATKFSVLVDFSAANDYVSAAATYAANASASASSAQTHSTSAASSSSAASSHASSAEASSVSASNHATDAQSHADTAHQWASQLGSPVSGGEYSARHYASQAQSSATIAATESADATVSASLAESYAATASTKASDATTAATISDNARSQAAASAGQALSYADQAATSATNAQNYSNNVAAQVSEAEAFANQSAASQAVCQALHDDMTTYIEDDMRYAKRIDFFSDTVIYKAEAMPGTADSSPNWRIHKITIAGDNDIVETFADGNSNFDNIWNDRLTLSYS